MLGPEYLASLPEPAVKLWQQAEDDILQDIARRFKRAGAITTTAAWQAWRLEQTHAVYTDTEKKLAEYTSQSREVIRRLLIEAGTEALLADDMIHRQAGKEPPPANQSGQLLNLLNAGYRQTLGTWLNLTATTANTVSGEFEHALSRAWLQVSSGAFDYNTAIRRAVDDLADHMAYVTYPSGHKDTLETAVRRAVLTGVNQTAGKLQMARAEEMGCEFVEVTAHEGARPTHALWQGRIYHIGGETDYEGQHYEDFVKATGYGTGAGLCGWNCRHNFYPFYPGISVRAYTDERLAELNAPSVEYRGKKYTRYEISQMQRAKERTVRKYKRRFLAESEAGLDTGTSAVRLKAARQDLKQFIRETGSKEDSARISVHGFGRSAAGKATWAAKKSVNNQVEKSVSYGVGSPNVDFDYIKSDLYKKKFDAISDNQGLNQSIYRYCKAALTHQSGNYYEDLIILDKNGILVGQTSSKIENATQYSQKLKRLVDEAEPYSLISIHNHGTNIPPSGADLVSAGSKKYAFGIVACHDGSLYYYTAQKARPFVTSVIDDTVDKFSMPPYNMDKVSACKMALDQVARGYGIEWKELL